MRVKELADLTGTTVRTVRYYHQIGLLPVPPVRDGSRDYDLVHVARLIRVRWLSQAGVPLSRVAGMLRSDDDSVADPGTREGTDDREAVLTDLTATLVALDDQLELLQAQRDRVRRLIAAVERQHVLSPMPSAVARFYQDLERRADDDEVRRTIRREREFMELAFYRDEMPAEVEVLYQGLDEAQLGESLALFGQFAGRTAQGSGPTDEQIRELACAVVDRIARQLGPELRRVASSVDPGLARRAADLYVRVSGVRSPRLERAIGDALLAAIAEARE